MNNLVINIGGHSKIIDYLYDDGTHINKNCLYFMSKPKSVSINCTKKGFISREFCSKNCKLKNIK